MTKQSEILNDDQYVAIHEYGFCGLVDSMGSDDSIVQAARVSYGRGTKAKENDQGLIRYLMRHRHTTPFEMVELKFHIKAPIFVARQWVRHRTASINEYSGRYSVMSDEFYIPENFAAQSESNKQGSDANVDLELQEKIKNDITFNYASCLHAYQALIRNDVAREQARIVLPVANYTEFYWKINLHNLFHFLKLRMDPHAQKEIRDYAFAICDLAKPLFPIAFEAWEDYAKNATTFSAAEMKILRQFIDDDIGDDITLSGRERKEFFEKL